MIAALHIDWLRAAADIVGAFCCAYLGQEWGYRRGFREGALFGSRTGARAIVEAEGEDGWPLGHPQGYTPPRESERLP